MKLFKSKNSEWISSYNGKKYRIMYISDTEQYIVFDDGEIEIYDYPYKLDFITTSLYNDWEEIKLKTAFE